MATNCHRWICFNDVYLTLAICTMRIRCLLIVVAPLVVSTAAAGAQPAGHCKRSETTYFSCKLYGSPKIVSLCGGQLPGATADTSELWLQYRFGKPGHLELVYPKKPRASLSKFEGESRHGLGVRLDAVSFTICKIKYVLESSYSELTGNAFDGVRVYSKGQDQPISLLCESVPTGDGDFGQLANEIDPTPR